MVGVFVRTLLQRPNRIRGAHPRSSYVAVGPLAKDLIESQRNLDVFAPLRALCQRGGAVVLMGVGLDKMTLLHLAEQEAGREPFRRWAVGRDGEIVEVQEGGCSTGFINLAQALSGKSKAVYVGSSKWECYDALATLRIATAAIKANAQVTWCGNPRCLECRDSVAGGPTGFRRPKKSQ